jgi:hypothetical protein
LEEVGRGRRERARTERCFAKMVEGGGEGLCVFFSRAGSTKPDGHSLVLLFPAASGRWGPDPIAFGVTFGSDILFGCMCEIIYSELYI